MLIFLMLLLAIALLIVTQCKRCCKPNEKEHISTKGIENKTAKSNSAVLNNKKPEEALQSQERPETSKVKSSQLKSESTQKSLTRSRCTGSAEELAVPVCRRYEPSNRTRTKKVFAHSEENTMKSIDSLRYEGDNVMRHRLNKKVKVVDDKEDLIDFGHSE